MEYFDLIKARYSCRKFSPKPVEDDKLEKILDAAVVAPTAKNVQPFEIFVLKSPEAMAKIKEVTKFVFGAPVVMLVGAKKDGAFVRPFDGKNFAEIDASIVATHVMLAAHDLGLGSTWVGYFDEAKVKALFPEMAEYDFVALFPIGYPADDAKPSDRHTERKNKSEVVKFL